MSRRFGRGLVVGKFAPLHLGHCLVIDTCAEQSEETVIISWAVPERARCDVNTRRDWLENLYPQANVLVVDEAFLAGFDGSPPLPAEDDAEVDQRRFVWWLCHRVLDTTVDAVFGSEPYVPGFADDLALWFGHPVEAVLVDPDRVNVPISATTIRNESGSFHRWLPVDVAATFVRRVVFLGGESSGKSTLAVAGSREFGNNSQSVAEYGRERWETQGGQLEFDDLLAIADEQVRRERAACHEVAQRSQSLDELGIVFCDTSPLTTLFYCQDMFGRVDERLRTHAERSYDLTVLCAPDFEFVQDGTRRHEGFRDEQHQWYLRELAEREIEPLVVIGPVSHRVQQVLETLTQSGTRASTSEVQNLHRVASTGMNSLQ
jgi:HTH-type transcriptional regulator, transcriptional repressor of NAD biosynthesis genes